MTAKFNRAELLRQLQDALDLFGARPARWPENARARLSALVESDDEAARMFREAKALDTVLSRAPKGVASAGLEMSILTAVSSLPQNRAFESSAPMIAPVPRRRLTVRPALTSAPRSTFWGGAALLAASLILGVFIGLSGQAISTLQNIELLASNDADIGIAFSGSLFEPSELHKQGKL